MKKLLSLVVVALLLSMIGSVEAGRHRSSAVRQQFLKRHGLTHTPKGAQVDHIWPLECGGTDTLDNLWLTNGPLMREKERLESQHQCAAVHQWLSEHPDAGIR